jgi:hypothetical protein
MSYYYQDPEYTDYSNHSDEYNEYESYSDYAEPNHCEYEDHKYVPQEFEQGHEGAEHAVQELKELIHEGTRTEMDWEGEQEDRDEAYEHGELMYGDKEFENDEHEVHEHGDFANDDNKMRELKELERIVNEEGYSGQPQGLNPRYDEIQKPPQRAYELEHELGYSNDGASEHRDHEDGNGYTYPHHPPPAPTYVHTPATPSPPYSPTYDDDDDRYTPAPTNPHLHPPCPLPFTCSPRRPSPGASESRDHIEPEDRTHTPPLYSNLNQLRHKYNLGIPSTVAYMQGLQEYTEECLCEQEEWNADQRAEIHRNHWIKYPKRDFYTTPRSWDLANRQSVPRTIEKSRPFYPTLKRRHYKNHRAKRYPNPRSQSPAPSPEQRHLGEDGNIAHTPLPPTTLSNKHHGYNNSPKPVRATLQSEEITQV